jgi:RNA polymerase sigma factor (sigma-70 family)
MSAQYNAEDPSLPPDAEREYATLSASSKDDLNWVQAALNGDEKAFKLLFDKYKQALHFHLNKMVRDKEVIHDLIQEIFVKAFSNLASYQQGYAFSTWLYRIATNHTIDYLRKKKLSTLSIDEPIVTKDGSTSIELQDIGAQADELILSEQRNRLVHDALQSLPEKYRIVIEMRHMEEKSYQEIAEALDIPLGTVKAHIFRARELLFKYLKDRRSSYWEL